MAPPVWRPACAPVGKQHLVSLSSAPPAGEGSSAFLPVLPSRHHVSPRFGPPCAARSADFFRPALAQSHGSAIIGRRHGFFFFYLLPDSNHPYQPRSASWHRKINFSEKNSEISLSLPIKTFFNRAGRMLPCPDSTILCPFQTRKNTRRRQKKTRRTLKIVERHSTYDQCIWSMVPDVHAYILFTSAGGLAL